jgi:hypothetical protein
MQRVCDENGITFFSHRFQDPVLAEPGKCGTYGSAVP